MTLKKEETQGRDAKLFLSAFESFICVREKEDFVFLTRIKHHIDL